MYMKTHHSTQESTFKFFFKSYSCLKIQACISTCTCSGLRLALRRDTISPTTESTRSAGVDVAVMARYFLDSLANKGNLCPLTFHQSRGDECRGDCSCFQLHPAQDQNCHCYWLVSHFLKANPRLSD